jgi:hypothetical protein
MAFYVRRFNSVGYFIGYSGSLQPMIGPPDWAIGFSSTRQAYDQVPAVLHGTMEVVGETGRAADIEQFRFDTVDAPEPFAPQEHADTPPF